MTWQLTDGDTVVYIDDKTGQQYFVPNDPNNTQRAAYNVFLAQGGNPLAVSMNLAQAQARALSLLAGIRYKQQTGGTVINGAAIKTDPESLTLINGAKDYIDACAAAGQQNTVVNFKTSTGAFVTLNQAQMTGIALAVAAHVQGCFSNEGALTVAINAAATVAAVQAIDLNAGWPA